MNECQNTKANDIQTENIVKRLLTSEVKYAVGLIVFIVGVVAPYYSIKTDIELIKQNHLAHIEVMQGDILDLAEEVNEMKKLEIELLKEIVELGVITEMK